MLDSIDQIDADIAALTAVIEQLLAPCEEQLQQAESMPGWGRRAAQDVLAETGADMSRFRTAGHLASWAGRIPLDRQSGNRTGRARHKHGNRYIGAVTGETSAAAGKTQTREGARYRRLTRKQRQGQGNVALGNTQMRVYHVLLSTPASATKTSAGTTTNANGTTPPGQPPLGKLTASASALCAGRGRRIGPWVSWRSGPRVRLSGWAGALGASGRRVLAGSCRAGRSRAARSPFRPRRCRVRRPAR